MKKQIMNLLLAALFALILSSGISVAAQGGSLDREHPQTITSRTITSSVSRPLGEEEEVFYAVAARKGYLTVDFTAVARDGMNIVLGVEGSGVFESIGPLISGGDDKMQGTVTFKVPSRHTLLINVRYSGNARYTIKLNGSALNPIRDGR